MKFQKQIELSCDLIEKLQSHFSVKIFKSYSHLFYEGQIPISGYLILEGFVQISKKNKLKKMFQQGTLIGLAEVLNKIPSKVSAEVFPNTTVCFLDRSTVLELKNSGNEELVNLITKGLEVNE